ncbi:DUF4091 domain-containing protein [Pedobacter xixiisoli]|uniref:Uncharacterized protein n=1 Tax=Pedobacter xixiisoli TaxID=1476464 RepID=A0A285ZPM8_9SPHI|nr:DUF4091 domain-containing protein [Pedobacter xixiisoli]SOD11580.1 protein of unknown function [Pedobacter xixiisoli]
MLTKLHLKFKCLLTLIVCSGNLFSQVAYQELPDPKGVDMISWKNITEQTAFKFASADVRYQKHVAPSNGTLKIKWEGTGWRGEKIHTKILVCTKRNLNKVSFALSKLTNKNGNTIDASNIKANFVRYVMTDGLNAKGGGCEITPKLDSSLVEDVIDNANELTVPKNTVQPIWLTVTIPTDTKPGLYSGSIYLKENNKNSKYKLNYTVKVINRVLPSPNQWKFHLDLWQNPYAISRVSNTKQWSAEHFRAMTPYMNMLANAGQKTITTTLIHDPWNSQTYDKYGSMIKWTKKNNGSWQYDFSIFDQWVSFAMSLGIKKQINCYSMIPWDLKFAYYDEATGKDTALVAKPGSPEYTSHWTPMLKAFATHLKSKGWFNITCIAMDERPVEDMEKAIAVIKSVDKDFKIALAGRYHPEIEKDIFDYCVASNQVIEPEVFKRRKAEGFNTTVYTSCTEGSPNIFTFSPPAESAWLPWFALNNNYDGYLRWAYNCWNANPLQDSRFGNWSAGDAFFIYPGARTSIRFEKLISGIQDYEKIKILSNELSKKGLSTERLKTITQPFLIQNLKTIEASKMLSDAKKQLNSF